MIFGERGQFDRGFGGFTVVEIGRYADHWTAVGELLMAVDAACILHAYPLSPIIMAVDAACTLHAYPLSPIVMAVHAACTLHAYPLRPIIIKYHPCSTWANASILGALRCSVCLLYTSPSPRDGLLSRMPSSA